MFCSKCGDNLSDDSQFCNKCGTPLGSTVSLSKTAPESKSRHKTSGVTKFVILALLFVLLGWIFVVKLGKRTAVVAIATAVHSPVTLKDEIENLPARSWKAIALTLPYSGTLSVTLEVARGNPLDVFLIAPDQLESVKEEQWKDVEAYAGFGASKMRTYRREVQMGQGSYYLVLRDTSFGILSQSASDVSVKINLNP